MPSEPLGLRAGTVQVAPYDTRWPSLFASEAARVAVALGALPLRLEHIGSTSVPGLPAKPIIDILAGRPAGSPVEPYIAALVRAGYEHRGEAGIPGRQYFRRGEPRLFHVHLAETHGEFWRAHLVFRDVLRARPELAAEYAALKHRLTARHPADREAYLDGKGPFIQQVLAQATRREAN